MMSNAADAAARICESAVDAVGHVEAEPPELEPPELLEPPVPVHWL
jgi:hypothetical protein